MDTFFLFCDFFAFSLFGCAPQVLAVASQAQSLRSLNLADNRMSSLTAPPAVLSQLPATFPVSAMHSVHGQCRACECIVRAEGLRTCFLFDSVF